MSEVKELIQRLRAASEREADHLNMLSVRQDHKAADMPSARAAFHLERLTEENGLLKSEAISLRSLVPDARRWQMLLEYETMGAVHVIEKYGVDGIAEYLDERHAIEPIPNPPEL